MTAELSESRAGKHEKLRNSSDTVTADCATPAAPVSPVVSLINFPRTWLLPLFSNGSLRAAPPPRRRRELAALSVHTVIVALRYFKLNL
jgi:hypothetical protein